MDSEKAAVRTTIRAYARRAVDGLNEAGVSLPLAYQDVGGWEAIGGGMFAVRELRSVSLVLHESLPSRGAFPEYASCEEALRAHSVIGPRLNQLVGTAQSQSRLEAGPLLDTFLYRLLAERDPFDPTVFDAAFEDLYDWLTREHERYLVMAPLSGLAADGLPIQLEAGVEIDDMSDDEVIACLNGGLIGDAGAATGVVSVPRRTAIRLREEWPLLVGDEQRSAQLQEAYERRKDVVEAVVHMLRLFKSGTTSVPGTVTFPAEAFEGRAYNFGYSPAPRHLMFERYRIDAGEGEKLVALWRKLRDTRVTRERFLTTALRRFAFAGERPRPEDEILDLVIASEALFTPKTTTEVTHKVALRAALFLHGKAGPAPDVFASMKRAYGARSKVAHGDTVGTLSLPDGSQATLEDYVALIAGYLRVALKDMVDRAVQGHPLSDERAWNEFTLERLTETSLEPLSQAGSE